MPHPRRHAAALLAVLLLAAPPALAAEPILVAQIDDATPTPTAEAQPPLSEEPPEGLGGDGDEGEGGNGDEESTGSGGDREPLPETGVEAGLIALLGLGLIASGSGLRLTLGRGNAV